MINENQIIETIQNLYAENERKITSSIAHSHIKNLVTAHSEE